MLVDGGGHLIGDKDRSEENPILLLTALEHNLCKVGYDKPPAMMIDLLFLVAPIKNELALLQSSSEIDYNRAANGLGITMQGLLVLY